MLGVSVENSRHTRESGYPESRILLKILDSGLRGHDERVRF